MNRFSWPYTERKDSIIERHHVPEGATHSYTEYYPRHTLYRVCAPTREVFMIHYFKDGLELGNYMPDLNTTTVLAVARVWKPVPTLNPL